MTMMASSAANTALQRGLEELLKSTAQESSFEATNLYNISKEEEGEDAKITNSDSYDSQDDDDVESDVDEEAEAAMVQALVAAAFSKTSAASAMADEVLRQTAQQEGTQASNKKRDATESSFSSLATSKRRRISVSAPALVDLVPSHDSKASTAATTTTTQETPETCLRAILAAHHLEFQTFAASTLSNFFTAITDEAVARYTLEMVQWVREENVEALRAQLTQGGRLDCRNKFGETLLHAASRRGATSVVQFLVNEAHVPCQVACDRGRTPLHDACWTCQPKFAPLIQLLLEACPDLLYITDQRGLTPLAYVPRQLHGAWCAFLRTCPMEHLTPKQLSLKPI